MQHECNIPGVKISCGMVSWASLPHLQMKESKFGIGNHLFIKHNPYGHSHAPLLVGHSAGMLPKERKKERKKERLTQDIVSHLVKETRLARLTAPRHTEDIATICFPMGHYDDRLAL